MRIPFFNSCRKTGSRDVESREFKETRHRERHKTIGFDERNKGTERAL